MREYFRGWKRKMGVMTLVPACVLAVAWFRSLTDYDMAIVPLWGTYATCIESLNGVILCDLALFDESPKLALRTNNLAVLLADIKVVSRELEAAGFDSLEYNESMSSVLKPSGVPYWSIILPLTLLSAWLLLSKPRKPAAVNSDEVV